MIKKSISTLLLSTVFVSAGVFAQQVPSSGSSGSFGFGIDTFASNTPGANTEEKGGFAKALEEAFTGNNADCGKLKCD